MIYILFPLLGSVLVAQIWPKMGFALGRLLLHMSLQQRRHSTALSLGYTAYRSAWNTGVLARIEPVHRKLDGVS